MNLNKTFYLLPIFLSATAAVQAQTCVRAPDCGELGYNQTAAECAAAGLNKYIKCPFDQTKVYCGAKSSGGRNLDWANAVNAETQTENWDGENYMNISHYSDGDAVRKLWAYTMPEDGCLYIYACTDSMIVNPGQKIFESNNFSAENQLLLYASQSLLLCFQKGDVILFNNRPSDTPVCGPNRPNRLKFIPYAKE